MSYENCFGNTFVKGPVVVTHSLIKNDIQRLKQTKTER